ncbi:hypothetical protein [Paenibacillus lactis]|uniref:hypothetical protein n=1 Tax=Paenibacillus lactis TaxID=228574 RepID=UPI003680ECFF
MSEQNKIEQIKEDLNEVADEVWEKDVFDVITNQDGKIIAEVFDKDAAQLFAKSNKYITYLLQEIERLQGEVQFWRISAENQQQNNFRFMAEIERKDEALRFYADKENYNHPYVPAVVEDAGKRAREAL